MTNGDGRTMDSDDIRCDTFPYQAVYIISTNTTEDRDFVLDVNGEETLAIPANASAMSADETPGDYYCTDAIDASCSRSTLLAGSLQSYLEDLPSVDAVQVKRTASAEGYTFTVTFLDDNDVTVSVAAGGDVGLSKPSDGLSAAASCTGSYVVNGLDNGQDYMARVYAYNSMGFSLPQVAEAPELSLIHI